MTTRLAAILSLLCLAIPTVASAQDARDFSAASARVSRRPDGAPFTPPAAGARGQIVAAFLRGRHDARTVETLVLDKQNPVRSGLTHVTMRQQINGLAVYGTYVRAAVTARGELVSVVENLAVAPPALVPNSLTPRGALDVVIGNFYPGAVSDVRELRQSGNTVVYSRGGLFSGEPTVTRVAVPMANGAMHVGLLVVTWDHNNVLRHTVIGPGGRVLVEELRTNSDTYKIFPDHPGNSIQTVVSGPGSGNAESPIGWVSSNTTTGNNVDAYLDRDNNNGADSGGRPASSTQNFEYTVNLAQAPTTSTNQMAAVTNLFYLNNVIHDKLYRHGFTEVAGNFQTNNFGKGGNGNDPVRAEAQDGGGTNNANFATPADGSSPRMQMYLWTFSTPNRDGDLDSDIVWHEYGHGLTWRMIGGMSGPFAGAIGEGMSDTLAIYINRNDVVGDYSLDDPAGIRRFPYSGYPLRYGDVSGSSVHDDGEIYAATMWRLLQLWEGSGRTQDELFDYVVDGMNFTPSRPAFEDMRDGILAATPTQEEDCIVWTAFAEFGIGEGADGTERCRIFTCSVSVTESFVVPSSCSGGGGGNTAPTVSITSPANGATFASGASITFSGTASDQQDGALSGSLAWTSNVDGAIGTGASFVRTDLSPGTHTITAAVTDGGGLSGSQSINITIQAAPPPTGFTLTVQGYKVKGVQHADLSWSGTASASVDVYRNNAKITSTPNDGAHTDNIGQRGGGSYTYRVCEAGTTVCSDQVTIVF